MNIERILTQFEKQYNEGTGIKSSPEESRKLIKQYTSVPLTLPVSDESMRRVCEVLTRAGYQTIESCEGHGQYFPEVFFLCPSQYHIRHLTRVLVGESRETNFPWQITTYTGDVFLNGDRPLNWILEPELNCLGGVNIQDKENYDKMIDDLDIIGICILRYFSSFNIKNRRLECFRKKVDEQTIKFKTPRLPKAFFE